MNAKPEDLRYRRDLWKLCIPGGGAAEIGVAEGNFAQDIMTWPCSFSTVYLVDRWRHVNIKGDSGQPQTWHDANLRRVKKRMMPFGALARILQMDSGNAVGFVPDASLSFVNVDADHSYNGVSTDARIWWPKLLPGGVIAFHDYENPGYGVKKAVQEFAGAHKLRVYNLREDKPEDAGAFLIKPTP